MNIDREALVSERLRLEFVHEGHADRLFPDLQDVRIYCFIPQDPPETLEHLQDRYRRLSEGRSQDGREVWLNWVAFIQPSGPPIGVVEITLYPASREADLAYVFFPHFWGRGFAREACARVLDEARRRRWARIIRATMDVENAASRALVETLGFQRVGYSPDVAVFKGRTSSEYVYEIDLAVGAVADT